MGPREEDNSVFLLGAVTLVCGMIAFIPWLVEATPAKETLPKETLASANKSAQRIVYEQSASPGPVRVILPFSPNTTPSRR